MTFLPIVGRELQVSARRPALYRGRMGVALATTLIAGVLMLAGATANSRRLGGEVFSGMVVVALVYVLLEGLRAADAVSEEKREGTLGLLFLTDLRGYDIVLGKFAALILRSFHGVLAFLPILALALILGGVTAGEFWRAALVLVNSLFLAVATGLAVSVFSRESARALLATALVLITLTLGTRLVAAVANTIPGMAHLDWVRELSPVYITRIATDASYGLNPTRFWRALAWQHTLGWGALFVAAASVSRAWQEKSAGSSGSSNSLRWRPRPRGDPAKRARWRARLLDEHPIAWLTAPDYRDRTWVLGATLIVVGLALGGALLVKAAGEEFADAAMSLWVVAYPLGFLLKVRLAWQAARVMAQARASGAIELILATPVTLNEFVRGQTRGLKKVFLAPALVVLALHLGPIPFNLALASFESTDTIFPSLYMAYAAVNFSVSMLALTRLGQWLGFTKSKPAQAFVWTVALGVLLPPVLVCIPSLMVNIGLYILADVRLWPALRRFAAGDGGTPGLRPAAPATRPSLPARGAPPVLDAGRRS